MKNLLRLLALALWLAALPAAADPPEGYPFTGYDRGLAQARTTGKPMFLYFGRYGCAWCDKTNRESFSDPEIRRLYTEHYVLVYVDAESGRRITLPSGERITEAELGARLRAFATPLFVFLDPEGREIVKIPGFKTAQDFHDYDRYVHGGHYRNRGLLEFLADRP